MLDTYYLTSVGLSGLFDQSRLLCRVKDAKCKLSNSATKYQLDPRGDLPCVWIWVLNALTVCKRDAFNLELTCLCLSRNQCYNWIVSLGGSATNWPNVFIRTTFNSQLFFRQLTTELGPMLYKYYLLLVVHVNIFFIALIELYMAKSPC